MRTKRINLMVLMTVAMIAFIILFSGTVFAAEIEEDTTLVWASYVDRTRVESEGLDLVLKEENLISLDTEYKTFGSVRDFLGDFFIETNQGYFITPTTDQVKFLANRIHFDGFERVFINLYEKDGEIYIGLLYPDRMVSQYGSRGEYELFNYNDFHYKYINGFTHVSDYYYLTAKTIEFHCDF